VSGHEINTTCFHDPTNEKKAKNSMKPRGAQQAEGPVPRRRAEEQQEENPHSPSLPQLPPSTSSSVPPRLPSPVDEETAIAVDTRVTLLPEGEAPPSSSAA